MPSKIRFELSLQAAQEICHKYNLEEPKEVVRVEKGMTNDVFSLNDKYMVKIATFYADLVDLSKEQAVYGWLKEAKVPCPKVLGLDRSKQILPYCYLVLEKVRGLPLDDCWPSLSAESRANLITEIGNILAKIHSIQFPVFGECLWGGGFVGPLGYKEFLQRDVKIILDKIAKENLLSTDLQQKISVFFSRTTLFDLNVRGSLTHLGYNFSDFIVEGGKVTGVIDWEWARSAHHEEDLALFFYRMLHMDPGLISKFREAYEKTHKLDKAFEKRLLVYNFLYYLRGLYHTLCWSHRPDKQREYLREVEKLAGWVLGND
ncbi:MAG TPA: aminoglycoside phosphotransferase family protein [Candidatus Nanoarchaeia archaeon]|nr:aminoglycoside phosphotransferase family protein [Candidatus Nanoarchaeia archaeon]